MDDEKEVTFNGKERQEESKEVKSMGCGKIKAKDVGRKGHHYIRLSIKHGKSHAIGGLRTYKKGKR